MVTALFDNAYQQPLPANLATTIKCDGINKSDLSDIRDKAVTCTMLSKLAIKYSDGVIVTEPGVAPELVEYANKMEKKVLMAADPELDIDKYDVFFDEVAGLEQA